MQFLAKRSDRMIKIGEFIRKYEYRKILDSEGNTITKQMIRDYMVLSVDGNILELMHYRGTPNEGSVIHEETEIKDSYELVYINESEIKEIVIYKETMRHNIPCKVACGLQYTWNDKSVEFPYTERVRTPKGEIELT